MRTVLLSCLLGAASVAATQSSSLNPAAAAAGQYLSAAERDTLAVTGRITDRATGQGLPGATILLKGTSVGVSTQADGSFSLTFPVNVRRGTLVVSAVGYVRQELSVRRGQQLNLALWADTKTMSEVVVTGKPGRLAKSKRADEAKHADYEMVEAMPNMAAPMSGRVAGVAVTPGYFPAQPENRDSYEHKAENGFQLVSKAPLSTFSIDVDAALIATCAATCCSRASCRRWTPCAPRSW